MDCYSRLLQPDNLYVAYLRARQAVEDYEGLIDREEFARWEGSIEAHLDRVRSLLTSTFPSIPCRLVPIPKAEGKVRAYHSIPLEYQVGWVAIVQALGPLLDRRMAPWSFGYRLHRPRTRVTADRGVWLWDDYLLKSPALYLGFAQAWKPFRRYANLTVKRMLGDTSLDDPREQEVLEFETHKAEQHHLWQRAPKPGTRPGIDLRHRPFPYLLNDWRSRTDITRRAWFAHLDMSKFFPSLRCEEVRQRCLRELRNLPGFDSSRWSSLLTRWLRFSEYAGGIPAAALKQLAGERVTEGGLPVGLIASGFLANVYMMEVDRAIENRLATAFRGRVAVLRYVDDHVIIADDRDVLCRWLAEQIEVFTKHNLSLNPGKVKPAALGTISRGFGADTATFGAWLRRGGNLASLPTGVIPSSRDLMQSWLAQGSVTRLNRQEFVSTALQRMSRRADEDVDLLDEDDIDARILDLTDLAQGAEDHQEVRPDTLEAFAAVHLERTPAWSPAALLDLKQLLKDQDELARRASVDAVALERLDIEARQARLAINLKEVQDHTTARIRRRTEEVVRQVVGSLLRNPHKHRLLERWVRSAATAAEVGESSTYGARDPHPLCTLLSGEVPAASEYTWTLSEGEWTHLKPTVLSFLRMRAWSALSSCAGDTLRQAAMSTGGKGPEASLLPSPNARVSRRLRWLTRLASDLRRSSTRARRTLLEQQAWIAELETQALHWWELFEQLTLARPPRGKARREIPFKVSQHGSDQLFARTVLLPWTRDPGRHEAFASKAQLAIAALADRVIRSKRRPNDVETATLREWVLAEPVSRARSALVARLCDATPGPPRYTRDAGTVGWVADLAWSLAASREGELVLTRLGNRLHAPCGPLMLAIAEQRSAVRTRTWNISLRGLLEAVRWPDGALAPANQEPPQALNEAVRVALARGIIEEAAACLNRRSQVYLAPDNIFVRSADWTRILADARDGRVPSAPLLQYRPLLPDPVYIVPTNRQRQRDDVAVAAGLCCVAIVAGLRAARTLARVGTRSRLVLNSVWDAIETGPALSHAVVRQVATLCAAGHLRAMNQRMRAAYAQLYGTPMTAESQPSLLQAARLGMRAVSKQLADASTRSEDRTLYVVEAGLPKKPAELGESLEVTIVQLDLDLLAPGVWSFARGVVAFTDEFITEEGWPRLWRALRAVRASFGQPQQRNGANKTPRLVVFPELAIPRRYIRTVRRLAQALNAVIVAGVEYGSDAGWATNQALVAIPAPERHPAAQARLFWVGKHYPSVAERQMLAAEHVRFYGTRDFIFFQHPTIGRLGAVICYDLYAVETLVAFQGHVLHLVIPAYNRDLTTFDGLTDAAMRLLFANVILANTGRFGGSLAVAPFYEAHDREMLQVRGQNIDTVEHLSVPLAALDLEQRKPKWAVPFQAARDRKARAFKTKPADWRI